jgi:hypothetical protein
MQTVDREGQTGKNITKIPFGFNDKVATKKSNAKKYINEMM